MIGSHTLVMTYAHVAHDCIIGDHVHPRDLHRARAATA